VAQVEADAGRGSWGDLPLEAGALFVDQAYLGGDGDGSQAKPWPTISEATANAPPNALVAIAAGAYVESVVVSGKTLRLSGRCPALVSIAPLAAIPVALRIQGAAASGSEIHRLALTGNGRGFQLTGSENVLLDELWYVDLAMLGIGIQNDLGPSSVIVERSLFEMGRDQAIFSGGSTVVLSESVIHDTIALGVNRGRALHVQNTPSTAWRSDVR
jgi:hypothetical protein